MAEQLINPTSQRRHIPCFFSKQLTLLESRDFIKNEDHLKSCLDCRQRISEFENYRLDLNSYYQTFKVSDEIAQALERELNDIIPSAELDVIKGVPTRKKTTYSLSPKDFLIYLIFGIPRKIQALICLVIFLAAFIY